MDTKELQSDILAAIATPLRKYGCGMDAAIDVLQAIDDYVPVGVEERFLNDGYGGRTTRTDGTVIDTPSKACTQERRFVGEWHRHRPSIEIVVPATEPVEIIPRVDANTGVLASSPTQDEGPRRIRLQRFKGYQRPADTVQVAGRTKWTNPFTIADALAYDFIDNEAEARTFVVDCFEDWLYKGKQSGWWWAGGIDRHRWMMAHRKDLMGKNLGCFCDGPAVCEATILLRWAAGKPMRCAV